MSLLRALSIAVLCTLGCSRTGADVRTTDSEVGPPASSSWAPATRTEVASAAPPQDAGDACRSLPIETGGTLEHQSFEGQVALATGHDPEQGNGTFPVLLLDAPVCAAYKLAPQRVLLLGVLGGKPKWDAFGAQWNGQRVRVTGDVRSMDIYVGATWHFLLFVSHVEPLS